MLGVGMGIGENGQALILGSPKPERPAEAVAVMRMENRSYAGALVTAVIEHWGTQYMVTLKLGHVRQLSSPFEVIEFELGRGRVM